MLVAERKRRLTRAERLQMLDEASRLSLRVDVQVHRYAAALVLDLDRAVLEHAHGDLLAEAGQRLVDGVVDRLLHDVQRVDRVGVHARHAPDRLQPLQGLDRGSVVNLLFCHVFSAFWGHKY